MYSGPSGILGSIKPFSNILGSTSKGSVFPDYLEVATARCCRCFS